MIARRALGVAVRQSDAPGPRPPCGEGRSPKQRGDRGGDRTDAARAVHDSSTTPHPDRFAPTLPTRGRVQQRPYLAISRSEAPYLQSGNPRKTRRRHHPGRAAAAASALFPAPAIAQSAPKIVVIGGGFGGANCARALKVINPRLSVTLIAESETYTAFPLSNAVLGGLRPLTAQQFGYQKIAGAGVTVASAPATTIDPKARIGPPAQRRATRLRPARDSAGRRRAVRRDSRAMTKPRPRRCRMPGPTARKSDRSSDNSRRCPTAAAS